jgi:gamma-glutamyltranspeptidase/glutathione hydrolase
VADLDGQVDDAKHDAPMIGASWPPRQPISRPPAAMLAWMQPTRPELRGTFGMVSSTHWLASAAGMAMLERGGNAFDAAVAAGFVLQVVEPHLNGPGGDLPVIAYDARQERVFVVNGQGPTPAAAGIDRFRALGLDLVPGTGLLAACVPGAFGAWMLLLAEHGTMRPRDVLEPAIGYAEGGFPALPGIGQAVARVERLFREEWPWSAEVWLAGGVPAPGGRLRNPLLAATWRRLLAEAEAATGDRDGQVEAARAAFYEGFVAEAIAGFVATTEAMDTSGRRHRGLLDGDDLRGWRPTVEAPVTLDHHGWTVCKTGPWGQGPVFLQQLALLEEVDLAAMEFCGEAYVHTVVECAKLAFADREAWYGDPAAVDVPLDGLLDPGYAASRRGRRAGGRTGGFRERGADLGRHLPRGRGRPPWQPGLGDPERGLAAELPGRPRARLLPGHPRPDAVAGGGAGQLDGRRHPAADHPQPVAGAARRGALPGLRHPGR